jgi:peptidoglycan/xylan/chitin deacetylase (PgdA/CDA1 family)
MSVSRKDFLKTAGLFGAAGVMQPLVAVTPALAAGTEPSRQWADGSRLILSISMQFESGGEPEGAESPFPRNLLPGYPDLPAATWYAYGYQEGIPRMLDLWDRFQVKVTSHMVGAAVQHSPQLAREIVARGHEAAAHGMNWSAQYQLDYAAEKKFIADGVAAVKEATGVSPVGYNANWLRRGVNTLDILHELDFLYHIDDLSRDEPFITKVKGGELVTVPYTLRCNDIMLIEGRQFSANQFLEQLKLEFDQLYLESATRRRMMSVSFHDRIGGTPQMVAATAQFLKYALGHKGVVVKRKDEIARMALADAATLRD